MPPPAAVMAVANVYVIFLAVLQHVFVAFVVETALLIGGAAVVATTVAAAVEADGSLDDGYEPAPRRHPPAIPARARWEHMCVR